MLNAIARKCYADLRGRPMQVALLFLVIAAAAATLSLALNVQGSSAKPYDRLREESNGADLWISTNTVKADYDALARLAGVKAVSGPVPVSWSNYGIRNGENKQQVALVGMGPALPDVDRPVVTDGRWLTAGATNELVIDRGAARMLKLDVGQKLDLLTTNGSVPMTIVGFAVPAGRAPAPIFDPAFAYVLPETLRRIEPDAVFGTSWQYRLRAGVQLDDPSAIRPFVEAAGPVLGTFDFTTWQDVRSNLKEANTFDVIFLNVFSLFALFAAGLIIANAVGGQVLSQLRETGILKAIGFTPAQVTLVLLGQNVALSIVASLVGVLAGLLIAPFFLERTAEVLGVPAAAAFNPTLLLVAMGVVVALVTVFTFVPAWRAGRIGAIAALNTGNDAGPSKPSRLVGLLSKLGAPRVAVIGIKDVSRRPVRTAMTVAALVLAVVTATFSLGIEATFSKTMGEPTVIGGPPYDIASDRDTYPDAEARRILDSRPEVESYVVGYYMGGSLSRPREVPGAPPVGGNGFDLRGFEGNLNSPRWAVREGRMPERAGEASISSKFADDFSVAVGQELSVFMGPLGGEPLRVRIVGRYADAEGAVMTVTRDSLPASVEPTDYLIRTTPGTDNREFANTLIRLSNGNLDPEVLTETIAGIRDQWRPVLLGLNALLFFIAGMNLLSSLLLSIRERRRDFAVLKTLGFTPGQVAQAVFAGSAVLALVAIAVGLPLGLIATRVMFDVLSSAAGIGTGVGAMPGVLWLLPLIPGAVLVATLASVIPARRAAAVQVAEVLRYE